jgi:hypothetical protein
MTKYGVKLTMSAKTHSWLIESGLKLLVFKAVSSDNADSAGPVVWMYTPDFGTKNNISWHEDYEGYFTTEDVEHGNTITARLGHSVNLGHGLKIIETNEKSEIVLDPHWEEPDWIHIDNQTSTIFAVGLEQTMAYASSAHGGHVPAGGGPICAFNINEHRARRIKPLRQVLFMFSASTFRAGTIVTRATDTNLDGCLAYGETGPNYPVVEYTDNGTWVGGETIPPGEFMKACIQPEKSI